MKIKTSVTLAPDVAKALTRLAGKNSTRSAVIERLVREFVAEEQRRVRDERDIAIINRNAKRLNREAADALSYQVDA